MRCAYAVVVLEYVYSVKYVLRRIKLGNRLDVLASFAILFVLKCPQTSVPRVIRHVVHVRCCVDGDSLCDDGWMARTSPLSKFYPKTYIDIHRLY